MDNWSWSIYRFTCFISCSTQKLTFKRYSHHKHALVPKLSLIYFTIPRCIDCIEKRKVFRFQLKLGLLMQVFVFNFELGCVFVEKSLDSRAFRLKPHSGRSDNLVLNDSRKKSFLQWDSNPWLLHRCQRLYWTG